MMHVSVEHPTDRPNFCRVQVGKITIYFSYDRTPIAFHHPSTGTVVRENDWGPTTGKHLNYVDNGRQDDRVSGDVFRRKLSTMLNAGEYVVVEEEELVA